MTRYTNNLSLVTILVFLLATCVSFAQALDPAANIFEGYSGKIIRSITFAGKFKVKQAILHREIESQPGQALDAKIMLRDQKKIDGLGIFSEVRPFVNVEGDSVDVVFNLSEIWTLTPIVSASQTDGTFDWMVGAHERDLLGFYCNVRGFYRRFEGEDSYVLSVVLPRAFRRDLAIGVSVANQMEKDPWLVEGIETNYRYLNKYLFTSLGLRVAEKIYPSLFFGYQRESWNLISSPTAPLSAPQNIDYPRYTFGTALDLGRIYSNHFYYDGLQLTSAVDWIRELPGQHFDAWRLQFVGRAFTVWKSINLCGRAQYLTSSENERVLPYALAGDLNVRGFRNNLLRGDQLLGVNFEARRRFIETKRWYSQVALFVDAASVWGRYRDASDALRSPYWSLGGGLRLAFKKWPKLGRADLIYNTETGQWTYYLSSSQFF